MEEEQLIEAYPLLLFVSKYFWRHFKRAPSIDQNLKGILTPEKSVQQASFDASNVTGAPNENIHINIVLLNVF